MCTDNHNDHKPNLLPIAHHGKTFCHGNLSVQVSDLQLNVLHFHDPESKYIYCCGQIKNWQYVVYKLVQFWCLTFLRDYYYWTLKVPFLNNSNTGCPKKNYLLAHFWVSELGRGVFRGKNNSKNFGNKKNIRLFSKILSKWTLFCSKSSIFLEFL